jgi:hypothetical protein
MPLIAVDISTTAVTPINIPSMVKAARILFALIARQAIANPSDNSKNIDDIN